MAYFSAVLAREGTTWRSRTIDVAGAEDLAEVAERLRGLEDGDEPVVLVLEREDDWFALVRVDGEDDPRVFVSDPEAALSSPFAAALGLDPETEYDGPAGDLDVLADLGLAPDELEDLTGDDGPASGDLLGAIAEEAGFAEVLDALR